MRAQIVESAIVAIGALGDSENVYDLPEKLPLNFEVEFHLYNATVTGGVVELQKARSSEDTKGFSIVELDRKWQSLYKDYKQARDKMKQLVSEKVLTTEEERIAASWFVLPATKIHETLGLEGTIAAGHPFNLNSIASREARLEAAMRYARNVVPYESLMQISMELDQHGLEQLYIKKGLEGTMMVNYEGRPDSTGLFDYLFGTGGFTGAGLPSKNIVFLHNLTLEEVTNRLKSILIDGKY